MIFSITIILLSIQTVKAESVTRVMNDYYYLRTHPDGTRYSDRDYTYFIDGKVVYCIEPGVRLGSDYSVLDNYNIPYENKLRILLVKSWQVLQLSILLNSIKQKSAMKHSIQLFLI